MRAYIEYVGATACGRYYPNEDELRAIGDFTRENILRWMDSHTRPDWVGIVPVEDFHAVCDDIDIPWATVEGKKIWDKIKEKLDEMEKSQSQEKTRV